MMETDIVNTYADPEKLDELSHSMFPTNQFTFTCETEVLDIDKRYAK
jgi:hypothetical protein